MKLFFIILLLPLHILCQNTIGLPDVTNYAKQTYNGGLQNWDIKQDKNGIIYVANNEGLLSFDGKNWNLNPLPNKTIVRSVEIGTDNRIYVGGQDEMGYFSPTSSGNLEYHSLVQFIPSKNKVFGDVWDIVSFNKNIFFRASNKIFKLTNNVIEIYDASSEWGFLGICNGKLYSQDFRNGLLIYENGSMVPLAIKYELPTDDPITSILALENDTAIVTTLKHGLYKLWNTGILSINNINNTFFKNERIYAATVINKDWIALATNSSGVYITDHNANIVQSFAKKEGLQNNNVLSIFLDQQKNLWLGLDNGIDLIAYNSAIKQINPSAQDGSGYAAIIKNNQLYLGTTNGLFTIPIPNEKDLSFVKAAFLPVNNARGQVWGLANINNELLLGKHEGAFLVKNNTAIPISSDKGYWNFLSTSNTFPSKRIIAGNYKNVEIYDYVNGHFSFAKNIEGFEESSRYIAIDKKEQIWVSHPYHGVYKIFKTGLDSYNVSIYTNKNGLPSTLNNHVYKIKNEVVIATEKGIYNYNESKNSFEASAYYKKIIGDQSIRYLKEDPMGNIWFIHEKTLNVIDFSDKEPVVINLPELNNKMLSGFESIYPVNENNIFLGGEKGFFIINYTKYKQALKSAQVLIRRVKISGKKEEILFGGYFTDINEKQIQSDKNIPTIKDGWKTIQFQFASPIFGNMTNLQFSYRLKGFDTVWSNWSDKTEKEYTNLPIGTYHFEVKVRNNLGRESDTASYSFKILAPWYLSVWAWIFYFLSFGAALTALFKWQEKKFINQKRKYEEEQKKLLYIHELEINKTEGELVALRNEKLEAEIKFKNAELASSAMHLVKKGELLSKSKTDLAHVMKGVENPQAVVELKKMIKTLNEDDKMDKEWETFSKHFDTVHSHFLSSLKDKHPNITGNEMKLCAYLRMNFTTKEIAQLMNISVRGVEIGRYRLRKKLQLETSMSLFDYLIGLK